MTRIPAAYRNQRGFTLIELLVVISLIDGLSLALSDWTPEAWDVEQSGRADV